MTNSKDNRTKGPNVPPLRFPGFTDEWKKKTIGEVAPLQRGFDLPTQQLEEGEYPVVYSNGIMNHHASYKCKAPGIITGRSGTVGKFTYIDDGYYWPHNTSLWVTSFFDNSPKFIYYLYQTIRIEQYSTGSGVPTLNRNDVHRHKVRIPKSIDEQNKIARLLSILDERIATQNKIIDNLQSLIKGLREYIFKKQYSDYVYLGDIAQLYQPRTISTSDLEQTGYLVYGANGVIGHYHSYNHERPQICITCRGNTCGQVTLTSPFSWITGNAMVINIDTNNSVDQSFLFHFLSSYNYTSIISGSGQPQIVRSPLEKIKVPFPELYRQQKISNVFNTITDMLSLEQTLLVYYQRQKEFLLRQMFI